MDRKPLLIAVLIVAMLPGFAWGNIATTQKQDLGALRQKAEAFLLTQSQGYPGKVEIQVGGIDPRLQLASCASPEVFLPTGSRAWGKTSIGIRCTASASWTIYVQANVSVMGQYLISTAPLAQGHVVSDEDLMAANGDLTRLPPGIFTEASQAVGRTVGMSLMAGAVLRQDMLKTPMAIQRGQTVLVTSHGQGFSVSAEGKAMGSAGEGQIVQVKVASGELVSGVARPGGQVEVRF